MSGILGRGGGTVGRRLGSAFGLLIFLIALCGAGALIGADRLDNEYDEIIDHVDPAGDDRLLLRSTAVGAQRSVRGYLITGDPRELAAFRQARDSVPSIIDDLRGYGVADEGLLTAQQRELTAYFRVAERQTRAVPRSERAAALTREATRRFRAFERTNDQLGVQLAAAEERMQDHADTVIRYGVGGLGALLVVGLAAAVFTSVRTTRALKRPLRNVEATLDRLAAGDRTARATPEGPAEIKAVAISVNALADERDRLRAIEEERTRLSGIARNTGIRIRENLDVDQVLDHAVAGIGAGLDADYVFITLAGEEGSVFPVARAWGAKEGLLSAAEQQSLPGAPAEMVRDHYRRGTTWEIADLPRYLSETTPVPGGPGSWGETGIPAENRVAASALGLVSALIAPMGVGEEPIGTVCLARTSADRPWRPVEIETAESMTSGVGRALHSARLFKQETDLVDKLRALDKAKSDFLSTVSHELRTPLTSIVGYIELLKDEDTGSLTPPQVHMLDIVDRNANRLRALIEDLLTLSRIESGAFTSRKAPVDLRQLVSSATDAIRPAAEAASVSLVTECPDRPLIMDADGEQLDRVLMNLLSNAVKFTPEGGKVSVRAHRHDGEVLLSVSDTGIGIPAKEQEKLFTRFFRASNATDAAIPGTGLGLTIVRTIVANHGGETHVHSEEGRGTTITARLPLADADRPAGND
ncbi:HAMP domain-containing protein [Streptomyces sp. HUCO-GS316]|uniref:ATP-binding protein n=1 Tax=Streptomyces sp. HUCO-GS316 TaxID=2692198 RepID=UPI001370502C|nr:HAMP domain-containing protein [Streptomyces sp. HUCO-GS316]